MPTLLGAHRRFARPIEVVGKGPSTGLLDPIDPEGAPIIYLNLPRRLLQHAAGLVEAGDTVIVEGQRFLAGNRGVYQGIRTFLLFEVTGLYTLRRSSMTTDPVTNLPRRSTSLPPVDVELSVEPLEREDFDRTIQVRQERYRIISGAVLHPGDVLQIDGVDRTLKRVYRGLGLYIGEAQ